MPHKPSTSCGPWPTPREEGCPGKTCGRCWLTLWRRAMTTTTSTCYGLAGHAWLVHRGGGTLSGRSVYPALPPVPGPGRDLRRDQAADERAITTTLIAQSPASRTELTGQAATHIHGRTWPPRCPKRRDRRPSPRPRLLLATDPTPAYSLRLTPLSAPQHARLAMPIATLFRLSETPSAR